MSAKIPFSEGSDFVNERSEFKKSGVVASLKTPAGRRAFQRTGNKISRASFVLGTHSGILDIGGGGTPLGARAGLIRTAVAHRASGDRECCADNRGGDKEFFHGASF